MILFLALWFHEIVWVPLSCTLYDFIVYLFIVCDVLFYFHLTDRILSLSWHVSDTTLVTGSSDSTVRLYNVKTGQCTLRITMEEFKSRNTLVWNVYITKYVSLLSVHFVVFIVLTTGKFCFSHTEHFHNSDHQVLMTYG